MGGLLASLLLIDPFVGLANAVSSNGEVLQATQAPAAIELSSCTLPGVAQAQCGVLHVAENPNRPAGRKLAIHVAVIPATNGPSLIGATCDLKSRPPFKTD